MISFATPWLLLTLPLLGGVAWWWRRSRHSSIRYSSLALVDGLPRGRARRAEWASLLLRMLILLFGILALAEPRYPDLRTRITTDGLALAWVCDISGSMAERDFRWIPDDKPISRLEAMQRAFTLFVQGGSTPDGETFPGRSADAITLVSFAATPRTECPLTLNHSVVTKLVNVLEPREGGLDAGTNIGDAIAEGLIRLRTAAELRPILIVLSDGEHNASSNGPAAPLTPRQAAQLAANLGITIYSIDCGGELNETSSAEAKQQRLAGREVLQQIAAMTQGRSFIANDGVQLRAVYRAIDALETRRIVSAVYRRYHELRSVCIAIAASSFALLLLLERVWWRRLPG